MKKVLLLLVLSFSFSFIFAQKNVIDKIVAIVGDEIILQSDIENAFLQQQGQGIISSSPDYKAEKMCIRDSPYTFFNELGLKDSHIHRFFHFDYPDGPQYPDIRHIRK